MSIHAKNLLVLASMAWLTGCAGVSQTEENHGNAVRNFVAKQQIAPSGPLQPDEPLERGDGRRLENVNTVYQTKVGDPSPVVRQVEVDKVER